jgi:GDPmannose 4,6-dehydratase
MNALIFGAGGQDALSLAGICRVGGITPIGVSRTSGDVLGDVGDRDLVEALVRRYTPRYVFHLAAASTTRHDALFENHRTISTGTLHILESVRLHSPGSRVFLTGSGVQFENRGEPISERDPFQASSPYAVSRIDSVHAGRYFRSLGLRVYVGYLFHHESPLRRPGHVSQTVASAARRIGEGSNERLEIGDLSVEKEWTFAGDVARAIFLLVNQDEAWEATIGSGLTHTIQEWVEACFGIVGKDWRGHVSARPGFVAEYRRLVSDPATIHALGWAPRLSLTELARMMTTAA